MNQLLAIFILFFSSCNLFSQVDDSTALDQDIEEVQILQNFAARYRSRLTSMQRVYPIALKAKKIVEEHTENLDGVSKKRKRKKLGKETHKSLKDEFEYAIRDLYKQDGELLIRLIHRETGMTVAEIIEVFEGKTRRKWYGGLANLGGQNIEDRYDPKGKDYLTELIIEEIEGGIIPFSRAMKPVDKQAYKEGMKEYRADRKEGRKARRNNKK